LDDRKYVPYIIGILEKYPPLTIRLYSQFEFFKACLTNNFKVPMKDSSFFVSWNKKLESTSKFTIINKFNNKLINSNYFHAWLSGFMEIKGYFLINIKRDNTYSYSFYIEHNSDYYILYKIYKLYNINVKIKNINNMSYTLKTFNKNNLNSIINHCISYPLQGEKSKLLNQFIKIFYK
jgi:hypothetical protein